MDYKKQVEQAKLSAAKWRKKHPIVGVGELRVDLMVDDLTRSITELLARAEAAEARCETLEKMVKEYQEELIPGYRERAEKAERERDTLLKEFAGECGMCVHYEDCTQNHYSCCGGADWEWIGLKEE